MKSSASGLVPVHIGQPEPGSEAERILLERQVLARTRGYSKRSPQVPGGLDWQKHGLQPRWLGTETSDCAVAIEPGYFHGHGDAERDRFLAGARRRKELALAIVVIGDQDHSASSVHLSTTFTSVNGRPLPSGTRPEIAPDLMPADRDLALRLLVRPADAPWWTLHLSGAQLVRGDGSGTWNHEAEGQLHPILVDALGDPVVAAWTPPSSDQRWYIIPHATDWNNVLDWLTHRALREYLPSALRRAHSAHFVDPELLTNDERAARQTLEELEETYAAEKLRIEQELRDVEARAEPIRHGLLYGTDTELVQAVASVLSAAGLHTVDLDEELGGTKSADLLVSADGPPRILVEVKGVGGAASESLVGHLQRHLETWPQLRPDLPVTGGVLVVNHQHKLHPSERTTRVYSRPEFVAALRVKVVTTVKLFHLWRTANWSGIRAAVGVDPPA